MSSAHSAENGRFTDPYMSDDDVERADCRRREPPCGIIGKHTHGDRRGTFVGESAPSWHSWQCMEAWMHPCRCDVDAPIPPEEGQP